MTGTGHAVTSATSCKLGIESFVGRTFWRRCSSLCQENNHAGHRDSKMKKTSNSSHTIIELLSVDPVVVCPSSSHTNLYTHSDVQYIGSRRMCNYQTDGKYNPIMAATMKLFHLTVPLYSCNAPAPLPTL